MTQDHENATEEAAAGERDETEPSTDELEEPSTEKEPGEEPAPGDAAEPGPRDPDADHRAVGIGVIDAPLVDPQAEG